MEPRSSLRRYQFRICGAKAESGEDIEVIIDAMDEGDACRRANQQGVYIASCTRVIEQPVTRLAASSHVAMAR